jgi:hypothetical protein
MSSSSSLSSSFYEPGIIWSAQGDVEQEYAVYYEEGFSSSSDSSSLPNLGPAKHRLLGGDDSKSSSGKYSPPPPPPSGLVNAMASMGPMKSEIAARETPKFTYTPVKKPMSMAVKSSSQALYEKKIRNLSILTNMIKQTNVKSDLKK